MKKIELIFIPSPGIGHLVSTVEMAKLLLNRDQSLSITVLIMKLPFDTKVNTYTQSISSNSSSNIRFVDLPEQDIAALPKSPSNFLPLFIQSQKPHVREAVAGIRQSEQSARLGGFVIDMFCSSMIDIANEFGLPTYVFFTSGASFLSLMFHVQGLVDNEHVDVTDLKDSDDDLCVPGFVNKVPIKVMPAIFLDKEGGAEMFLGYARRFKETKGVMINTFLELESYAIESLSDGKKPPIYPVGPVLNLVNEADSTIMDWLDQQPDSSVVFLCFGSMGTFDEEQVKEIAKALERSGHRFLWSLRKPVEKGKFGFPGEFSDPGEILPEGFLERTAGVGKVVGWAPQIAVLSHKSVGGFVSHCGWNSTLESVWCGVPMATWPMYAEQQINAFQFLKELGLAVEIKMDYRKDFRTNNAAVIVSAGEIESGIKKLMEDDGVRKRVKEMKEKSRMAMTEGGSSYRATGLLIEDVMKNCIHQ